MAETTYTSVVWTVGDILTEAKLDNMTANDRAVDAMNNGVEMTERSSPSTPAANKIHLYAKDKGGVSALYAINDDGVDFEVSEGKPVFTFTLQDTIPTGISLTPLLIAHRTLTIVKAYAAIKTGPTDADLIIDINKNGTSIWNSTPANRLKILDGATEGTQTAFNTTALIETDKLTIDIDQIGSTIGGADLTIELRTK